MNQNPDNTTPETADESPTRLSLTAKQGIAELRNRGVEPDLDDVIWLHELGKEVEAPRGAKPIAQTCMPVVIGNLVLHPITIGAGAWFSEIAFPILGQSEWGVLALAFALANAKEPEALWGLSDYPSLKRRLKKWRRTISVTAEELSHALKQLMPGKKRSKNEEEKSGNPVDWDLLIAWLCDVYGQTPDFWRWKESRDYALKLIDLKLKLGKAKGEAPDTEDPQNIAVYEFRQAIVSILRKHGK